MESLVDLLLLTAKSAVLIIIFGVLLVSYLPRWWLILKYKKLPPGPYCLPIVGFRHFLDVNVAHIKLKALAKKYGPVVSIFVGSRHVVVLDDFQQVKDSFNREEFFGRPEGAFRSNPRFSNLLDMNGSLWKEHRKFQMNSFRISGVGTKSHEELVMAQISLIKSMLESNKNDIEVSHVIELAINNSIFGVLYGRSFDSEHPLIRFLTIYDETMLPHFVIQAQLVFFPWAKPYFEYIYSGRKKTEECNEKMDRIVEKEIKKHRNTLNTDEPRDYIDRFIMRMGSEGADITYTDDILRENVKLLLEAGSGTTRVTMTWFLLCAAAFPKVQAKIQEEIDNVLGRDREPTYADRTLLPYTEAVILESMRWRNLIHLNVLREVAEDTTLMGYDIPKGTVIVQNMTSQFRNPVYWTRPDDFDPDRFLSEGKVVIPEHFTPFSYGRRACSGEKLAYTTIFLFSVSLLQSFQILPPLGGVNLDTEPVFNNKPAHPYLRFQRRE